MNREIEFGARHPDRLGLDRDQLAVILEKIDFPELVSGERLVLDEDYCTFMNDAVESQDPSALVLVSDDMFLFDGKPFRVVGKDMTAYMNVLLHYRHRKVDIKVLREVGYFEDDMPYQAHSPKLNKLRTATEVSSDSSPEKKLAGQQHWSGQKLHRLSDDCVVFDERATYAQPERAAEIQDMEEAAKEITYKPAKTKTRKNLGETALTKEGKDQEDEFPFPKIDVTNIEQQLSAFLSGSTNEFPFFTYLPSVEQQRIIKRVSRQAFDSDAKPEDFQLRLGLFNKNLIELPLSPEQ